MTTDTGGKIFEYIKKYRRVRPVELVRVFDFTSAAIHRQLNKLVKKGLITASGKPPKTVYLLATNEVDVVVRAIKKLNPEKIYLFGSRARGNFRPDSDLDICVIKKGDPLEIKRQVWPLLRKSNYDWELEPDICVYSPEIFTDYLKRGDPYIKEISKGRILYEQ